MTQTITRVKIGKGYYQSGYNKGFCKNAVIYLIDGFAYAKHKANSNDIHPLTGDLEGYVRVNAHRGFADENKIVFTEAYGSGEYLSHKPFDATLLSNQKQEL